MEHYAAGVPAVRRVSVGDVRKVKALLVAGAAAALTIVGVAPSAEAIKCDDSIDPACRVVFTVVCQVVAKGQPCVM